MSDDRKDELYYAAIDLLRRQVQALAPTVPACASADMWESQLKTDGHTVHRVGCHVWAVPASYDEVKPTLLLEVPVATALPVAASLHNPYMPVEKECCLYGVGTNRFGAAAVSLWAAFTLLAASEQPYNLIFLVSCRESPAEAGDMELVLQQMPPVDFAVVGAPTGMQPAISERGYMQLQCSVTGKPGSVAKGEGTNAIYKALPLLSAIKEYHFEKLSVTLGEVKMAVTQICADAAAAMIPDCCSFKIDVYPNECYTNDEVLTALQAVLPACAISVMPGARNASYVDARHPFVRRAELLGCEPFGSPVPGDRAFLPCRSVAMGPGEPDADMAEGEYIRLAEIREAIELFVNLLDDLQLPRLSE